MHLSNSIVLQQVSFVERSSLSQRVPYQRFHCVVRALTTNLHVSLYFCKSCKEYPCNSDKCRYLYVLQSGKGVSADCSPDLLPK